VPWDLQVANAAPQTIVWKKGTTKLQIRIPGLYRYALKRWNVSSSEDVFAVKGTVDIVFGQQCYKPARRSMCYLFLCLHGSCSGVSP
jgi:hypothetical protein